MVDVYISPIVGAKKTNLPREVWDLVLIPSGCHQVTCNLTAKRRSPIPHIPLIAENAFSSRLSYSLSISA